MAARKLRSGQFSLQTLFDLTSATAMAVVAAPLVLKFLPCVGPFLAVQGLLILCGGIAGFVMYKSRR